MADDKCTCMRCKSGRYDALVSALRIFPHFEGDEPVTPDAVRAIGREYTDMVMTWEPQKCDIEFTDGNGKLHRIIYESGDSDVGIRDGWVLADDLSFSAKDGVRS